MNGHAVDTGAFFGDRQDRHHTQTNNHDRDVQRLRHDLSQPLAAIGYALDTVEERSDIPVDLREALEQIGAQADWMRRVLAAALDEWSDVRVVDLAEVLAAPCGPAPPHARYEVHFETRGRSPVLVDPVDLERSARNLMDNAVRAVSDGGRIDVTLVNDDGRAVLEVADSGPGFGGLAPQHGHGLVGVRRFAERFGGHVVCGTSSLGGALVQLALPIATGW